jgi:hypothetical protein
MARFTGVTSMTAAPGRSARQWNGGDAMNASEFACRLNALTAADITGLASALRLELDTPDGEVGWWRATIAVGASLKRSHQTRAASLAAHQAASAVQASAASFGEAGPSRDDVIVVARAAAEVARAIVAGLPGTTTAPLFAVWQSLVAA